MSDHIRKENSILTFRPVRKPLFMECGDCAALIEEGKEYLHAEFHSRVILIEKDQNNGN